MAEKIVIVDDEKEIADVVELYLKNEDYEVHKFYNGKDTLAFLEKEEPDLAILDVMLPDIDGFTILQKIRETYKFPVIMLTAKSEYLDKITGLTLGADDYIAKPFKISILAMKAKRMLQRTEIAQRHEHRYAGIVLDTDAYKCYVNDEEVTLTQKEFVLLSEFMKNPGRVLTREWLLEQIWGYDFSGETRVVDTMVKNLRKKLGAKAHLIHTVISVGYKLEDTK